MIPASKQLNKEYTENFVKIIVREMVYKTNAAQYKQEIIDYIKTNSNGKYIELNPDLIMKWTKSGLKNVAAFVYARDGKKLDTKTTIKWISSSLV